MPAELPTYKEIEALHGKYAPSDAVFNLIFTHCQIVWEVAEQLIAQSHPVVDIEFVKAGCLLHDIGAYQLFSSSGEVDHKSYIRHGVLGDKLLRREGFSEALCRVASHHTGVGLSKRDIQENNLPLPVGDYTAKSVEERLIMYADKFHTKSTPPTLMKIETYRAFTGKFDPANEDQFMGFVQEFGEPSLALLAKKYTLEIM